MKAGGVAQACMVMTVTNMRQRNNNLCSGGRFVNSLFRFIYRIKIASIDSASTNSIFGEWRNLPALAGLAERGSLPPLAYRAFRQDCHKTPLTANCLKYTPSAQRQ